MDELMEDLARVLEDDPRVVGLLASAMSTTGGAVRSLSPSRRRLGLVSFAPFGPRVVQNCTIRRSEAGLRGHLAPRVRRGPGVAGTPCCGPRGAGRPLRGEGACRVVGGAQS